MKQDHLIQRLLEKFKGRNFKFTKDDSFNLAKSAGDIMEASLDYVHAI